MLTHGRSTTIMESKGRSPVFIMLSRCAVAAAGLAFALGAAAQLPAAPPAPSAVLFQNVRIFDGTGSQLSGVSNVLVRGNKIEKISTAPIPVDRSANTQIIDGGGRTLMPGLIDVHTHLIFEELSQIQALTADIGFVNLVSARAAQEALMRGFTSVRDLGGPVFGLKKAIDLGFFPGPRIWPSGAFISQTGGHGDFRLPTSLPARPDAFDYTEQVGAAVIADSPDAVRQRARENLALGASQLKLMAGGGVTSSYDPLDVTQYTVPEVQAAVGAAENWGTYVTVHAYTPRAIRMAIEAGVKCIEHGQLADEPTVKLMADKGIWWSLQPFIGESRYPEGSANRAKQLMVYEGTDNAYKLAKNYKVKTAWGSDLLFVPGQGQRRSDMILRMLHWYTPAETLRMITADNAQLLALSGPRSPYPGKLGVVEEGALADLLLVNGDPIADLKLLDDPYKNLDVIMKDGKIYKNTLP